MILKNKTIILAVSGGIAAYKSVDLASQLKKLGVDLHVVCTDNALHFVSKLSLQTMSGNLVQNKQYLEDSPDIDHITLADRADLILIAPATANLIGKLANGISDNLITDFCLATKAPVMVAPAMNTNMWQHKAVVKNLKYIKEELGYDIIDPDFGELACGYVGQGRLADAQIILERVCKFFDCDFKPQDKKQFISPSSDSLQGKKIIVTAGGTREAIDPVRYIANRSSGKMGFALADAAYEQGAEVLLISTQAVEKPYPVKFVESALDMQEALDCDFQTSDAILMAAAVGDYRVAEPSCSKLKKKAEGNFDLKLEANPDILKNLASQKTTNQILVGFALETDNLIENAKKKLESKKLDLIIANSPEAFDSDDNQVTLISRTATEAHTLAKQSKEDLAKFIIAELKTMLDKNLIVAA